MSRARSWSWWVAVLLVVACQRDAVSTTPASQESDYAAAYPERLKLVRARFDALEAEARASFAGLRDVTRVASPANAAAVEDVLRRADAAGRSQRYADEALLDEHVAEVMSEGKGAVRRRVAGAVARAAAEKECVKEDADALAGVAASATGRALDRQLQTRLAARNAAHAALEARLEEIGAQRAPALARHADALARASFVAHVRLPSFRRELEQLLDAEDAVQETLGRDEAEARSLLATETLSRPRRLAVEERLARDQAARQTLDGEVAASERALDDMRARAAALQDEYRALLEGLLGDLARLRAQPAAGGAGAPRARTSGARAVRSGHRGA